MKTNVAISFSDVCYTFPEGQRGVSNVNLHLGFGESVALMGANGSGKSTVLRLACALLRPHSGRLVVKEPVAYVAQNPYDNIVGETVDEDLAFSARFRSENEQVRNDLIEQSLSFVGMREMRYRGVRSLSGGQIQKVALAAAWLSGARIWILDEPTSYLPREEARLFWNDLTVLARTFQITLLYATHHTYEARSARWIYCFQDGRVVLNGPPGQVFDRPNDVVSLGIRPDLTVAFSRRLYDEAERVVNEDVDLDEKVARRLCSALRR